MQDIDLINQYPLSLIPTQNHNISTVAARPDRNLRQTLDKPTNRNGTIGTASAPSAPWTVGTASAPSRPKQSIMYITRHFFSLMEKGAFHLSNQQYQPDRASLLLLTYHLRYNFDVYLTA